MISEETYRSLKTANDPEDPMTAYVGFGMSFGAKFWGGYARNRSGTDYAGNLKRSTMATVQRMRQKDCSFECSSYSDLAIPPGSVVYLDPPYFGRTKQRRFEFDHREFWDWAHELSRTNSVFVTEFTIPQSGWEIVHNFGDTVVRHHSAKTTGDGTTEVLVKAI